MVGRSFSLPPPEWRQGHLDTINDLPILFFVLLELEVVSLYLLSSGRSCHLVKIWVVFCLLDYSCSLKIRLSNAWPTYMARSKVTSVLLNTGVFWWILIESTLRSCLRRIKHWVLERVSQLMLFYGSCSALIKRSPLQLPRRLLLIIVKQVFVFPRWGWLSSQCMMREHLLARHFVMVVGLLNLVVHRLINIVLNDSLVDCPWVFLCEKPSEFNVHDLWRCC